MKRSKVLLVSNILATIYSIYLLWTFGGAVIEAGGADFIDAMGAYFELAFDLLGMQSSAVTLLYVMVVLLCLHIATFILGCVISWLAYIGKKSGGAKFAATLYLIGTLCFPVYVFVGLPITVVGFVGGGKQKKLNQPVETTSK